MSIPDRLVLVEVVERLQLRHVRARLVTPECGRYLEAEAYVAVESPYGRVLVAMDPTTHDLTVECLRGGEVQRYPGFDSVGAAVGVVLHLVCA